MTEEFKDTEKIIKIRSLIMVERETQKGNLDWPQRRSLKKVGVGARMKLQAFFKKKVNLELYVKVNKDWRSNERQLKRFGYKY